MKKTGYRFLCYFVVIIAAIFSSYLVFYKGLTTGDDRIFHISNIYEVYQTLKDGRKLSEISGYLSGGLSTANRLFYGPVTHHYYGCGIYLLSKLNLTFIQGFKILYIFSVILTSIFMMRFALNISNGSYVGATIGTVLFLFYPYRLFDSYGRWALAESLSFTFLPLFFDGVYGIVSNKGELKLGCFFKTVIGGALLTLTHNITVLYAGVFALLLIIFYTKNVIKQCKNTKFILSCLVSVVLLFGTISYYILTIYQYESSGLYNISNPTQLSASVESVSTRGDEMFVASGFFKFTWLLDTYPALFSVKSIVLMFSFFLGGCVLFIVIDQLFIKKARNYWLGKILGTILLFFLIFISKGITQVYLAGIEFVIVYLVTEYVQVRALPICEKSKVKILKEPLFYWAVVVIVICCVLMATGFIWRVLPSIFLNIQFPWRLWSFFQLALCVLVTLVLSRIEKYKVPCLSLLAVSCLVFSMNHFTIEKELQFKLYGGTTSFDESILYRRESNGWNKEYIPQDFTNWNYTPTYSNSLYYVYRDKLNSSNFNNVSVYSIEPAVLEGNAAIRVRESFGGSWSLKVEATSDSLIQLPAIYYQGYEITLTSNNGDVSTSEALYCDGLLTFRVNQGVYDVSICFKGSKLRRTGIVISVTSASIVGVLGIVTGVKKVVSLKRKESI